MTGTVPDYHNITTWVSEKKVTGIDYCHNITSWLSQWKSPTLSKDEQEQIFTLEARNIMLERECERLQLQNNAMEVELSTLKRQLEQNKTMSIVGFDLKAQMDDLITMRTSQKMRDVSELIRVKQQLEIVSKERDELQQRFVGLLHHGVPPSSSPRPPATRKVSLSAASSTAQSLLSHREYDMIRNTATRVSLSADHSKGIDISQTSLVNHNNNQHSSRDQPKMLLPQNQTNSRTRQMGRYPDQYSDFASDRGASEFISASSVASNLPERSRCNSTLSHSRDADVAFGVTPSEFEEDCMLSDYGSSVYDANKSETSTRVSTQFSDFGVAPHKLFEFVSFMGRYIKDILLSFCYNLSNISLRTYPQSKTSYDC